MSEENKSESAKPKPSNSHFAKMRVNGKKGAGKPKPGSKGPRREGGQKSFPGYRELKPKGPKPEYRAEGSPTEGLTRPDSKAKFVKREGSSARYGKTDFKKDFRGPRQSPRRDEVVVSPSRREAAKALWSIENGAKISDMLEIKRTLIPEDEALLRELVYGCTRQKRLLDYHLNNFCKAQYDQLPVEVKTSLRLGLYQLLFLTRVPAHAAVFESVNLVKLAGQEGLAGFTNAVLRTIETKKDSLELAGKDELDTLAIKYSHPTWVAKRWAARWPGEQLEKMLQANNQPHPVFLNVRPGAKEKVLEALQSQKVQMAEVGWPANTLRLKNHEGGLFSGESFQQGDWIVQDWTPQAMMELLALKEGQRAWDVCAAPGGKTVSLAWRVGESGQVTATDASAERRKRLQENIKRVALKQVMIFDHEIEKLSPAQKFDLVWVDAPCSGTGVFARRADLRWKINLQDIKAHGPQQTDLLEQAQGHLYPKGQLVYSTCSLEKEENEDIVSAFLEKHSDFKVFKTPSLKGRDEVISGDLGTMFLPTEEHDGGFLSILTRE